VNLYKEAEQLLALDKKRNLRKQVGCLQKGFEGGFVLSQRLAPSCSLIINKTPFFLFHFLGIFAPLTLEINV